MALGCSGAAGYSVFPWGRVTGVDLIAAVLGVCEREGFRPYFLGATQSGLDELVARVRREHPEMEIAGSRNGYFSPDEEAGIVADIRASGADCLFVGISSPIKERFLNRNRNELGVPLQIGVGGAFDVLSGRLRRAPKLMQQSGLEWLFRLLQEPRRLAGRYIVSNAKFASMLLRALLTGADERGTPADVHGQGPA